jgi:U3 small nucleolar ribonucleoprotein protein IMP4
MPILITTSRRPTRRVRSFCKELAKVFPGSAYVNRGKMSLLEVLLEASSRGASHALVVNVRKANPGRLDLYDVETRSLRASFVCLGVKLAREMGVMAQPLRRAVVAVEDGEELESLAKALAEALSLPFVRERPKATIYATAAILSAGPGYLGAMSFLDLASGEPVGPLIRVKRLLPVGGQGCIERS